MVCNVVIMKNLMVNFFNLRAQILGQQLDLLIVAS